MDEERRWKIYRKTFFLALAKIEKSENLFFLWCAHVRNSLRAPQCTPLVGGGDAGGCLENAHILGVFEEEKEEKKGEKKRTFGQLCSPEFL